MNKLFEGKEKILNIYFTAGYPNLEDTSRVLLTLDKLGVPMVEVGIPFSDPLADGPTIQASGMQALNNGITLSKIFQQLEEVHGQHQLTMVMMGYWNNVLQFGVEAFLQKCQSLNITSVILPDLSMEIYERKYQCIFEQYNVALVFLITPQTSEERIRKIDGLSKSFIYVVSSASTTGNESKKMEDTSAYLSRIAEMNLTSPTMVGFNIKDKSSFEKATEKHHGGIIGSAFVKCLTKEKEVEKSIESFINALKA